MYRVLIVDDEYLSRFVLKTIISKRINNLELEIAGEAENGRQAIEMNRKLRPDIIIMDIKMPGINGIDATKEIINEFPDVSVLILTAYDNFDYIKRALDLGVKGYILKPVKDEDVVEKVNKVIRDIDERVNKSDFKEQVENKIKVIKPLIENELISSFISGNFDIEKVDNYINFLQVEIKSGYFMLISPGLGFSRDINESIRNRIMKDKIYGIAEKHLPLMKRCYFGNYIGNTVIAFFPVKHENITDEVYRESVLIGEEIKNRIKIMADIDVAVGIGNVYSGIQNLSRSYNEANYALKNAITEKKVVYFGSMEVKDSAEPQAKYPIELENTFIDQIKIGNFDKARQIAADIIAYIMDGNCKIDFIKECLTEFITVLKRAAYKTGVKLSSEGGSEIILELSGLSDLEDVNLWCKRNIYNLIDAIENKPGRNKDVINKAFEYINRHFTKDITLESVADDVGISPQYLSKMFKEGYGANFIDYITKKRVEYAQQLLADNSVNIKNISKVVGYGDPNYFCKIFKKDTGFTPKQYRARNTSGET
jgi:two-component system, response regulator YesN